MLRKVLLITSLCLLSAIGASAQGIRRDGIAFSTFGPYLRAIPGGAVRVCQDGSTGTLGACTPLKTIYTNQGLTTQKDNPFYADSDGTYTYYVASSEVDEEISGSGFVTVKNQNISIGVPSTGTITSFSAGNLSPLFTSLVATATTTPALTFALSTAAANKVFGNCTGSTAAPSYCSLTVAMLPSLTLSEIGAGTAAAGQYDFSGTTHTLLKVGAGYAPGANGGIGYDSTATNWMAYNGSARVVALLSGTPTTLDCANFVKSTNQYMIAASTTGTCRFTGGALQLSSSTGVDFADSGTLRFPNNESICFEANPTGTDGCLTYSTSNFFSIGNSDLHLTSLDATGLVGSPIFQSTTTADAADTGIVRLGNNEEIAWEANPAGGDIRLRGNTSNQLESISSYVAPAYFTTSNCADSAGDAACGSAAAGAVVVDAADTTTVVSTTRVNAASEIMLQFDSSLGTLLSVTCNTTWVDARVSARTASTSFTITVGTGPTTNPACFTYRIIN